VETHVGSPDFLVALNYFVAAGYAAASVSLVYASIIGYRHLTGGSRLERDSALIAVVLSVLWVGAALFLIGCGWHHIQHAQHLERHPTDELLSGSAYAAAVAQAIGEVIAIGAATLLISILNRAPGPSSRRAL
jgi:hypothetical protein